jgi:ribosomal protein L24E
MKCKHCEREIVTCPGFGWTHVKNDGQGMLVCDSSTRFCDSAPNSTTATPEIKRSVA